MFGMNHQPIKPLPQPGDRVEVLKTGFESYMRMYYYYYKQHTVVSFCNMNGAYVVCLEGDDDEPQFTATLDQVRLPQEDSSSSLPPMEQNLDQYAESESNCRYWYGDEAYEASAKSAEAFGEAFCEALAYNKSALENLEKMFKK